LAKCKCRRALFLCIQDRFYFWVYGNNLKGQLGDGSNTLQNLPTYNNILNCAPTTISTISDKFQTFLVYPNPASTYVNIEFTTLDLKERIDSIEIFNSLGEIVYTKNNRQLSFNIFIDISKYTKGIYYIKAGNGVRKLVIE
jgi:hypothetical protein